VVGKYQDEVNILECYWLYDPSASASNGIGTGSDAGCTRFGDGSAGTSWPVASNPSGTYTEWWVENDDPRLADHWKTLGSWNGGGTPTGAASTFPKLYWEED
jgi:hypothetical protein